MVSRPGTSMLFSRRSSVSMSSSGASAPREAVVGVLEPAAGQRLLARLDRTDDLGRVAWVERANVAAVDGSHRSHVAGAEALEVADLGVVQVLVLGRLLDGVEHAPRTLRPARDAGADIHVVAPHRR